MSGRQHSFTKWQEREARLASLERTFQRTAERAAAAMDGARSEIERASELLGEIAHLSAQHGTSGDGAPDG